MTIHGVKVYGANGELKQEFTAEEVKDLYNEKQKKVYTLSPNERRMWDLYLSGVTLKDECEINPPKPEPKPRAKPKKVIRDFKLKCKYCQKTVIVHNKKAVYCSSKCKYEEQKARQSKEKRSVKWRAKMKALKEKHDKQNKANQEKDVGNIQKDWGTGHAVPSN